MSCDRIEGLLSLFLYGELSFEEEEAVHQHLEECPLCRTALERTQALHRTLDRAEAPPPADLLADCRTKLRQELELGRPRRSLAGRVWDWLGQPAPPGLLRPAGALALVALGFFAARLMPTAPSKGPVDPSPATTTVRYLQPDAAGGVRIGVAETRQRVLSGSLGEADIQQLLLAAAQDASDPGLRLDSVDILQSHGPSPAVRQALLQAVQSDPNDGVRLKAIQGLKPYAADAQTRSVLSRALLSDSNVGVRSQAIDLLVQQKGAALAGVLQQAMQTEDDGYILLRCRKALEEMNASVAPF